jgi:hypothetical protein
MNLHKQPDRDSALLATIARTSPLLPRLPGNSHQGVRSLSSCLRDFPGRIALLAERPRPLLAQA